MIECRIETNDVTQKLAQSAVNVLADYLNKDLLELPALIGNTVIYLKDGKPTMHSTASREEAQELASDIIKLQSL